MKPEEMAALINVAFSLVELVVRLQKENPIMSKDDVEKMAALMEKINELNIKPKNYLENWKG